MSPAFEDHFGGHAADYAAHRPTYPDALYAWVADHAPSTRSVWDCGTGNGQAARGLATRFDAVHATDASADQIAHASPHPRVSFAVAPAEASGLPDTSVDAVTVAEALHWFDHPRFHAEVHRVLRPGGLLACWGYNRTVVSPDVDAVMWGFRVLVQHHWPPGREHLDHDYARLDWPYEELSGPDLAMRQDWTADHALAYLSTWSATKRCRRDAGLDPVALVADELREAWGTVVRTVRWPVCWRVGRVP